MKYQQTQQVGGSRPRSALMLLLTLTCIVDWSLALSRFSLTLGFEVTHVQTCIPKPRPPLDTSDDRRKTAMRGSMHRRFAWLALSRCDASRVLARAERVHLTGGGSVVGA